MMSRNNVPILHAAVVDLFDASHGVFGELMEPGLVTRGLQHEDLVGRIDDPVLARVVTATHSLNCNTTTAATTGTSSAEEEIVVECENWTDFTVTVRWMDEKGKNPPTHAWKIGPQSTFVHYAKPGHLFLLSIDERNLLLAAYRTLRSLPSNNTHCLSIEQQQEMTTTNEQDATTLSIIVGEPSFFVEAILTDDTKKDAMVVAAAALEGSQHHVKTIHSLSTIVHNILANPDDYDKYRTLRKSNKAVQHQLLSCPAAMQLLDLLGFEENGDCVQLPLHTTCSLPLDRFQMAADLLKLLQARSDALCPELAPTAPWQRPEFGTSHLAKHVSAGTHFISGDERWARVERWNSMRGSSRRRPPPGAAPSSRGTWGR